MSYIYSIDSAGEDGSAFTLTLREARKIAQGVADYLETPVEIQKNRIAKGSTRQLLVSALNKSGWATEITTVETVHPCIAATGGERG